MTLERKSLNGTPYWELEIGQVKPDTTIVLALHYMSGNAEAMRVVLDDVTLPLRVIFLEGDYPPGDDSGGYSWYPGEDGFYTWTEVEQTRHTLAQAARIAAFLRVLREHYPAKLVVLGISQGGELGLTLAAHYPALVDLVIALAARLTEPTRPTSVHPAMRLPRVVMLHGIEDEYMLIAWARDAHHWLHSNGYDAVLHEYPTVRHSVSKAMVAHAQSLLTAL